MKTHLRSSTLLRGLVLLPLLAAMSITPGALAETTLTIDAGQVQAKVSPMLYGLMTEEINFSYEGGIYAELLRNRSFKADATRPVYWQAIGGAQIALDATQSLNTALNTSLKLDAASASAASPAGTANEGYWGIPVKPHATYRASFYARAATGFSGPLTVALQDANGATTFASATVKKITGDWQRYDVTLKTGDVAPSKTNRFTLTTTKPGTVWLQQVSLFPETYKDRPNGNRPDLMQLLADMKPRFLRLPGGNYLEGDTIPERFDWKKTLGDPAQRPGHQSPWKYWSTDGMGLLEYLQWCENLNMEPVLAVYAGYSLHQDRVAAGSDLAPYVQDALDEIEYVTGDATTKWGAQRARDGHPAPFPLHYVEIGNEDWFDKANTYDARYSQFHDAIKAKYPALQLISTITPDRPDSEHVKSRTPDVIDQHLYPSSEGAMEARAHEFDNLPRSGPKIFVGEWATRVGSPTPNMAAALGDAAWMTGMERNSDLVIMESYAPLFVNVSHPTNGKDPQSSMQWPSDLIGYDALSAYGSPSYYAQVMFAANHGDVVLKTDAQDIPTWVWQPEARTRNGVTEPAKPAQTLPAVFYNVTRDNQDGTIFVKIVNRNDMPQPVHVVIKGAKIAPDGESVVMQASRRDDTNTLADPVKIKPVTAMVSGLSDDFMRDLPPLSITVLKLKSQ